MDADTDDEAEVLFRAKLQRQDADNPWGFRLQGGADFDKPLTLLKVVDGSIASKAGLQPGDIVFKLAGCPVASMTHKDAQEAIRQSANSLEIIVGRSEEKAIPAQVVDKPSEPSKETATAAQGPTQEKPQKEAELPDSTKNNHAASKDAASDTNNADATVVLNPVIVGSQNATTSARNETSVQAQNQMSVAADNSPSSARQNTAVNGNLDNRAPQLLQNGIQQSAVQDPKDSANDRALSSVSGIQQTTNNVPRTVTSEQSGQLQTQLQTKNMDYDLPPPVPPPPVEVTPPTVEVTPPSEPPMVTKPKTRRQRRPVQNDIPTGDIPSKEINESQNKSNESRNVASVEMVIPKVQRTSSDSTTTNLLAGVGEEKLLTTADRRSGSSSPRNSASPRLPSSPKLPSSPRASPVLPWQQFRVDDRRITHIPVSHERSSSDNGIPLLSSESVPIRIQHEASRIQNETAQMQMQQHHLPSQYSMVDLYPWRRPRSSSVDNSAGVTRGRHIPVFMAPNIREIPIATTEREVAPPQEQTRSEPMKASLKLVGRRIETGNMQGQSADDLSLAQAYPTIPELPEMQKPRTDFNTLGPEDIYFSAASPDLVDIAMPAVKEMVADLNRRLEAIAAQHPKLAEMSAPEFAISFEKKENEGAGAGKDNSSSSSEEEMREIFINSPPSDLDLIKAKMLGLDNMEALQKLYESHSLSPSKIDDPLKQSRRVHFADPPEQSVIEIEPRNRRHRRRPTSADPTTLDLASMSTGLSTTSYSSPVSSEPSLTSPYLSGQTYAPASQSSYSGSLTSQPLPDYSATSLSQPSYSSPQVSQPIPGLYAQQPSDASVDQYASYQPQPTPTSKGVNISISHRQGDQGGKQYSFTMPPAQPGQPTRFHYTISGNQPTDPFSLSYSIPPSYEESMRNRGINTSQFRSRDDTFLPSPRLMSPVPYQRSPTPDSFNLQHIRSYSPSASPTRMTSPTDRGSPQAIQSKSFKVLEATLVDQPDSGGNGPEAGRPNPMRVEVLGHPREGNQVLHPVAISRPFVPSSSPPMPDSPSPLSESPLNELPHLAPYFGVSGVSANAAAQAAQVAQAAANAAQAESQGYGSRPSSQLASFPIPASLLSLPPGVIALFDRDFTEKFLQWKNQRSHFESETCKLVREMDNDRKFGNQ